MKFGHVSQEQINEINLSLPEDHADNIFSKHSLRASSNFQIYVGCGKWGIPAWAGTVYPEGTKEKDFLAQYIKHFNAIELNSTFYRLSRSSLEKWAESAQGTNFRFCPKWSRRITHLKRLNEIEENTQYFMDSVAMLGPNLGASFISLPHNFGSKYQDRIQNFLDLLPDNYPVHLEFRHADWFTEPVFSETMSMLEEKGVGAVITDVALRRDALHMRPTCREVFIRFNGYGLHQSDFNRLDQWIERIKIWKDMGMEKLYFFMHQENEAHTPVLVNYFSEQINEILGLHLPIYKNS